MKSKAWIFYLIVNLVFAGFVGYLGYKAYFPDEIIYPDPVELFKQELPFGEELKIIDPDIADNSEEEATYDFSFTNNTEEEKTYYLYLDIQGDQILIDYLTVKIRDKGLLISYQPNFSIKTITLQPGETAHLTIKIYIDFLQVLSPEPFAEKSITLTIYDDYASFYGLKNEEEPEKKDDNEIKPDDDQDISQDNDIA